MSGREDPATAHRLHARRLTLLVSLAHLPYALWVATGPAGSALRAVAAIVALALLLWRDRGAAGLGAEGHAARVPVAVAVGLALGGLLWPVLWALSLPLAVVAWLSARGGRAQLVEYGPTVALAALAFPFERVWAQTWDPFLQTVTAAASVPLLHASGASVTLEHGSDPVLIVDAVRVTVTALCAGSQTLLALATLGAIIGQVFVPTANGRMVFVTVVPLAGLAANVVRVVLSTHAARWWAYDPVRWQLAHDAIGYGIFALVYLGLLLAVRRLRRRAAVA